VLFGKPGYRGLIALASTCVAFAAGGAAGLVIERDEDSSSTEAPSNDPGWANVGVCGSWTAVYLGRGWVLTAGHVGAANLDLQGVVYAADLKSIERIRNPDLTATDLLLFRVDPEPDLPALAIASESPSVGSPVVLVGNGFGRGERVNGTSRVGFRWGDPAKKRWGTGVIFEHLHDLSIGNTDTFTTRFSIAQTRHEAQAAQGDSGGAAFAHLDGRWQLAGIILAVDTHVGQPERTAAYGNRTFIADLARYRRSVQTITGLMLD